MDNLTQKKFDEVIKKEVLALTPSDILFLKARSSYLTAIQKEVYKEVLEAKVEVNKEPNLAKSRSYRAMQRQGAALGLHVVGVSREELERSLDTALGPR